MISVAERRPTRHAILRWNTAVEVVKVTITSSRAITVLISLCVSLAIKIYAPIGKNSNHINEILILLKRRNPHFLKIVLNQ